jgi:hypothetical protein
LFFLNPVNLEKSCESCPFKASILLDCHRQSRLAAKSDLADANLLDFMDNALADVDAWAA